MKSKLLFLFVLLASVSLFSCGDDDDNKEADRNLSDPRIRSVKLNNELTTFVVNDVENIIYNYDSLSSGYPTESVRLYFYGYVSVPTVQYLDQDNHWKDFVNGSTMNMSNLPVELLVTSQDKSSQKRYKFDLRIHEFDVDAFSWTEYSSVELSGKVVSQKSFTYNSVFNWCCRVEDGNSYCFSSSNMGKSWEKRKVDLEGAQWESLSFFRDLIWVQTESGSIMVSSPDDYDFKEFATSVAIDRLLFEVDGKLWAVKGDELYALESKGADFEKMSVLPDDFSMDNITTFTAASGFTQLGYIYSAQNGSGTIWSLDYKGNIHRLQNLDGSIPYLINPMVYIYDDLLGIVGGLNEDGTVSTHCYASYDSGVTWNDDWHKDLSKGIGGIESAGVFVCSKYGELVIVGGNQNGKASPTVWKGVLNKIIADEKNYQ